MLKTYLKALGSTDPGNIMAHNVLATIECGRASAKDVRLLMTEAARRWAAGVSKIDWGISCPAASALCDTIADDPQRWRFKGRAARRTDDHVSFAITFERLVSGDVIPIDKAMLRRKGFGRGLKVTKSLCNDVAALINSGKCVEADAKIGYKFGLFWATRSANLKGLIHSRDAAARIIESCGLYHFPSYPSTLMRIGSLRPLNKLLSDAGGKAVVPTFVEALNNLRFLGRDIGRDKRWGTALNMGCFRFEVAQARKADLVGYPEIALPAMKFQGNFSVARLGEVGSFVTSTDKHYSDMLNRLYGEKPHEALGAALAA